MAAEVRSIRTKGEYETALKEIERLWGAKIGTRDGDRLDVLANSSMPMRQSTIRWIRLILSRRAKSGWSS
jgi:antitoxin component HigA of HigAB toxin-antitoxin module